MFNEDSANLMSQLSSHRDTRDALVRVASNYYSSCRRVRGNYGRAMLTYGLLYFFDRHRGNLAQDNVYANGYADVAAQTFNLITFPFVE